MTESEPGIAARTLSCPHAEGGFSGLEQHVGSLRNHFQLTADQRQSGCEFRIVAGAAKQTRAVQDPLIRTKHFRQPDESLKHSERQIKSQ